jgi:hypothetical protein
MSPRMQLAEERVNEQGDFQMCPEGQDILSIDVSAFKNMPGSRHGQCRL